MIYSLYPLLKVVSGISLHPNTFKDALEIERIYIRHAFQNQGLGEILYNLAKTKATLLGKKQVWLGVWEYNRKHTITIRDDN